MHDHAECLAHALSERPHCADLHSHPGGGISRRRLLTGAGAAGAGALVTAALPVPAAHAEDAGVWRPDPADLRFTLVVMPDMQYLFDDDRVHPAPLDASLRWVLAHAREENIVFLAHLGDVTQNGLPGDVAAASRSFAVLDRAHAAYSVLAGNHDVDPGTNDQRGDTPYLRAFGPALAFTFGWTYMLISKPFAAARQSPDGPLRSRRPTPTHCRRRRDAPRPPALPFGPLS